jgi:NADH-quinone oxidoreductase subunit G
VADEAARGEVEATWGAPVPVSPGRDTAAILAAAAAGELDGVVVAGVDVDDLPDPAAALETLTRVPFCVSLEIRRSAVTDVADVVLPVAPAAEKAGSYVNWEGRLRPFQQALTTPALPDLRVLHLLAGEMGVALGVPDVGAAARELAEIGHPGAGVTRARPPAVGPSALPEPGPGQALLATWHQLVDDGRMSDGEPYLAGTARESTARLSEATAREIGVKPGDPVSVATDAGSVTLPVEVAEMPDRVVWLPTHSPGSHVRSALGAGAASGAVVRLAPGGRA